ncbi:hypothetical protein J3R82DRAFT_11695 [Butyriboletus roseoflavus]|nr:hypothetical protein J3R82DRAFT_11695 [Butyriboletus roseoflavus]
MNETQAFPCISTGVYGYPIRDATEVALKSVWEILDEKDRREGSVTPVDHGTPIAANSTHLAQLKRVIFVVFSDRDRATYEYVAFILNYEGLLSKGALRQLISPLLPTVRGSKHRLNTVLKV